MKKLDILFQDEDLLLVNKPPNYLSIPDRYDASKPNVLQTLRRTYGVVFPVHRLDKETSGALCFAKNEATHRQLNQQFQDRTIQKIYWALVDGHPQPKEGKVEQAIAPHPVYAGKMMVSNKGKIALTTYRVSKLFNYFSLVEVNIKTGRTHQIRVHLESIGHPLMVDKLYGRRAEFYLSEIKKGKYKLGKTQQERPLLSRSSLHAYQLSFTHPTTEQRIDCIAPLPKDFRAVLKQLHKWNN